MPPEEVSTAYSSLNQAGYAEEVREGLHEKLKNTAKPKARPGSMSFVV